MTSAMLLATNSEITDAYVIDQVLDGDTAIYEVLVRRYNTKLYRVAKGILKDEDDIEDVMQDTYIKAYEKLNQFKGKAQFSTWLTRILINEALASQKRNSKYLPYDLAQINDAQEYQPDIENKEKLEMQQNAKKLLEAAIASLPEKYRVIFMLREVEKLSVTDTASLLDISEENVKVRLHRAKGLLKSTLKDSMQRLSLFEFLAPRCNKLTDRVMLIISTKKTNHQF